MGLFDFMKNAGEDVDASELADAQGATDDKLLMAKLYRHLRNKGLEEKVQGLKLEVTHDKVDVSGQVESDDLREIVVLTLGNFQGVAGVEDHLTVPAKAAAPVAAAPVGSAPVAAHPAPPTGAGAPSPADAKAATPVAPAHAASTSAKVVPAPSTVKSAPAPVKPAAPQGVFHTVGEGSTLWAIAEKYLGDGNRFMEIFEANRPMLKDPDHIYPGQKLRIPKK